MKFHIITLFPETIESYLRASVIGRARKRSLVTVTYYNPRDFTKDKHKSVDDKAYGGGPGMVMMAEPILKAVGTAFKRIKSRESRIKVFILSPNGKQFTNTYADTLTKKYSDIILISGRYEGIDARVKKVLSNYKLQTTRMWNGQANYKLISVSEISIGPYTLTGGELPAAVIVDAVTRRLPGVLGTKDSIEERRTASKNVYTRPEMFTYKGKKYRVPKVLLSGHHKKIDCWRKNQSSDSSH